MTSETVNVVPSGVSVEQSGKIAAANPLDFITFVPWACRQLCLHQDVVVRKVKPTAEVESIKSKSKIGKSKILKGSSSAKLTRTLSKPIVEETSSETDPSIINIIANYQNDNLEGLTFYKNKEIIRQVLKVITLVVRFQPYLRFITINQGLNQHLIYELAKMVQVSNISEIKLDGNFVAEGNYDILVDSTKLKLLSLSRCNINDIVIKKIAMKLTYPAPAHQTLMILNLSTNRITDVGAAYIAFALLRNTKLSYLNLCGNKMTEIGANAILDSMLEYPLTTEDIIEVRTEKMAYVKYRNELISEIARELWVADQDRKRDKDAKNKKIIKGKGQSTVDSRPDNYAELPPTVMDEIFYEKATVIAETRARPFEHPFNDENTNHRDNYVYSKGNHTLTYLNLAYNELTYSTVKKLLDVLQYQKESTRKPKGLVNVVIEGIPVSDCQELIEIDKILGAHLVTLENKPTMMKRRHSVKKL